MKVSPYQMGVCAPFASPLGIPAGVVKGVAGGCDKKSKWMTK
jgi:hypothetical protein